MPNGSKPNWPAIIRERLKTHAREVKLALAGEFVSQHMKDPYFTIGGESLNGWHMQHCLDLIEASEGALRLPKAWSPTEIRAARAEAFAWQKNPLGDADYPADPGE